MAQVSRLIFSSVFFFLLASFLMIPGNRAVRNYKVARHDWKGCSVHIHVCVVIKNIPLRGVELGAAKTATSEIAAV